MSEGQATASDLEINPNERRIFMTKSGNGVGIFKMYQETEAKVIGYLGITDIVSNAIQLPLNASYKISATGGYANGYVESVFSGWKSGPCAGTNQNPCTITINNSLRNYTTITAEFTKTNLQLPHGIFVNLILPNYYFTPSGDVFGDHNTGGKIMVWQDGKQKNPVSQSSGYFSFAGVGQENYPEEATVQFIPDDGFGFFGWYAAPEECKSAKKNPCTFKVTEHTPFIPIIEEPPASPNHQLTIHKKSNNDYSLVNHSTVVAQSTAENKSYRCDTGSSTCSQLLPAGDQLLLTAVPANGKRFVGWSDPNNCKGSHCTITMNADKTIDAYFSDFSNAVDLNLTVKGGLGDILWDPADLYGFDSIEQTDAESTIYSLEFERGTYMGLLATPKEGYKFVGWSGDCSAMNDDYCHLHNMETQKSITATFAPLATINLRKRGTGLGSIDSPIVASANFTCGKWPAFCSHAYSDIGSTVYMTATAQPDSVFASWLSGPCKGSTNPRCNVTAEIGTTDVEVGFNRASNLPAKVCTARTFSALEQKVQDAFIAFYGRPADVGGLAFWTKTVSDTKGEDFMVLINDFAKADEYVNRFGKMNETELVNNLFMQLFARPADEGGLNFYVNELKTGKRSLTKIAMDIAMAAEEGSPDWQVLQARRKVANHYVTVMEATPGGDTKVILSNHLSSTHEGNADAVCERLSQALFP